MAMQRRRQVIVASALAAAIAVSASAMASWMPPHAAFLEPQKAPRKLKIVGNLHAMYPSRHARLRLDISNPLGQRVTVTTVSARVHRGAGPSGRCPASMLVIRTWHGSRTLAPGVTKTFHLKARMRRRSPDRCQGTRWQLTYHARSVRR